jgi:hypothetical protein
LIFIPLLFDALDAAEAGREVEAEAIGLVVARAAVVGSMYADFTPSDRQTTDR